MRHPRDGELRAALDGALSEARQAAVAEHLAGCARCRARSQALAERGARVGGLLSTPVAEPPLSARSARAIIQQRFAEQEASIMNKNWLQRHKSWSTVAIIAALAASLTLAPVRALAEQFLALFRVQQVSYVAVDEEAMPDEAAIETAMGDFEQLMQSELGFDEEPEVVEMDREAAGEAVGYPLRLPTDLGEPLIQVQSGVNGSMTIHLDQLRPIFAELGYDQDLPDELEGAEIDIAIGAVASAQYGECESEDGDGDCLVLLQTVVPQLEAPDGLDVQRLGSIYLQLMGLSPDEAEQYSAQVDWTSTLVLPLPSSQDPVIEQVSVDGVTGTLVHPPRDNWNGDQNVLTWIKDGVLYGLSARGSTEDVVGIANSLE